MPIPSQVITNISIHFPGLNNDIQIILYCFVQSPVNADKYIVQGGIEDMRHALFSLSHTSTIPEDYLFTSGQNLPPSAVNAHSDSNNTRYKTILVQDIDFTFKLNNTKLLTSKLLWRPNLKQEILVSNFFSTSTGEAIFVYHHCFFYYSDLLHLHQ